MMKIDARNCFATLALSAIGATTAGAATYNIDPDHTYPSLEFSHMDISVWRGKFDRTTGNVTMDRAAKTGSVAIDVETGSIDFGLASMKEFAVTGDWLNTAKFPKMTYKGELRFNGDTPVGVDGNLTLIGVTRPLKLKINKFKCVEHPIYKKEVCGADAEGDLNRADFGMSKYSEGEAGKIHLRIQVEAIRRE